MWQAIKEFFSRAYLIARSHFNYPDIADESDADNADAGLPVRRQVIAAVAERRLAEYFSGDSVKSTRSGKFLEMPAEDFFSGLFCNFTTIPTAILRVLSGLCFVSAPFLLGYFILNLAMLLADYNIWGAYALTFRLPGLLFSGGLLTAAIGSGITLRRTDQALTKKFYLADTREKLKDPEIYHQERCQLLSQQQDDRLKVEIREFDRKINALWAEYWRLQEMCQSVESVPDISTKELKELEPYMADMVRIQEEIGTLNKSAAKAKKRAARIKARITKSFMMASLAKSASAINDLRSGKDRKRIEKMDEKISGALSDGEADADALHGTFLIETGVEDSPDKLPDERSETKLLPEPEPEEE